eukprot:scaffold29540_cov41-Prasinocladus_malaysianus.AAC.2
MKPLPAVVASRRGPGFHISRIIPHCHMSWRRVGHNPAAAGPSMSDSLRTHTFLPYGVQIMKQ